ncbi:hypothetical protein [Candidatus Oscillochloris fontis]|uniref:hypothetical protein n=1 Tax=Candidatus Oscillochloris fontis TaxID=2496868 RepID=UPI00101CF726|nr:hypothetical protein [Candidatus Oscillochloris fontis]
MNTSSLLLTHLDTIAAAPGGVTRLRQLILQLAVQGRLVPQDPHDEPARVLVERARIIKLQLGVKGQKNAIGNLDITLTPLPETWTWTTLADLGLVNPRNQVADEQEVAFVPMNLIPQNFGENIKSEVRLWVGVRLMVVGAPPINLGLHLL